MSVIDTSVYVALFEPEEHGHHASIQWMLHVRAVGEPLFAPSIFLAEVGAAIRRRKDDIELGHAVVNRLRNSTLIDLIPITESLAIRSAEIAVERGIRGCDAIYVAVAEQVGHTLITLDNEQLKRGKAVIQTATPQEYLENWEALRNS